MNTMAKIKKTVTSCKRFDKKQIIRNLTKNRSLNKRTTRHKRKQEANNPIGMFTSCLFLFVAPHRALAPRIKRFR